MHKRVFIIIGNYLSALTPISNPCPKNVLIRHIQETLTMTNKQISTMWAPPCPSKDKSDLTANETTISWFF